MDILSILIWPLRYFAFNPGLCALLAATFTIPVSVPFYALRSRFVLALAALAWWSFAWREAMAPVEDNIRSDFVLFAPLYLTAAVFGAWHLLNGHRRTDATAAVSWRVRRQRRARS